MGGVLGSGWNGRRSRTQLIASVVRSQLDPARPRNVREEGRYWWGYNLGPGDFCGIQFPLSHSHERTGLTELCSSERVSEASPGKSVPKAKVA